jgi:hypothetical protein
VYKRGCHKKESLVSGRKPPPQAIFYSVQLKVLVLFKTMVRRIY